MKIAILDDYQDAVRTLDCFSLLAGHEVKVFQHSVRGIGQLAIRLAPFEALVLIRERTALPAALLARLPNLRIIAQTGKIGAHLDLDAATGAGIAVAEGTGDPTSTAELAWALILAAQRKIVPYARNLKEGLWQVASTAPQFNGLGTGLKGRMLGIWGYGRIGRLVAAYARAFGMTVLVWGSQASRSAAQADGFQVASSQHEFFEQADIVTLHLRLTAATAAIVGAADLARMKPDALLVNTSRAELIADGALEAALTAGRPGAAALDVFRGEPLAADSALLKMPMVLATPHLGYVERDSYETYFRSAFDNLLRFARGEPANIVNPDYLQNG